MTISGHGGTLKVSLSHLIVAADMPCDDAGHLDRIKMKGKTRYGTMTQLHGSCVCFAPVSAFLLTSDFLTAEVSTIHRIILTDTEIAGIRDSIIAGGLLPFLVNGE
jgi:hypothetical protein